MGTKIIAGGTVHSLPVEIRTALIKDAAAQNLWENLTPLSRNEWICWVTFPKKEETRQEHVTRLISQIKEGKRRPCCWIGCIHRTDKKISPSVQWVLKKRTGDKN